MTVPSEVRIRRLTSLSDRDVDGLSDLTLDCVAGGASIGFILPMSRAKAESFWRGAAAGIARGEKVLLVANLSMEDN